MDTGDIFSVLSQFHKLTMQTALPIERKKHNTILILQLSKLLALLLAGCYRS